MFSDTLDRKFLSFRIKHYILFILMLILSSSLLSLLLNSLYGFVVVWGVIFLTFIPGYLCSYIIYAQDEIGIGERLGLSIALSVTIVPLLVLYLNMAGITISPIVVILTTTVISIVSTVWIIYKKRY